MTGMTRSDQSEDPPSSPKFELALLSDIGAKRENNEDSCGHYIESDDQALIAVADGVGGYAGGEVASAMAIEIIVTSYRENPLEWGPAKRLVRAAHRANIEIHHRALAVPGLRRMATTLTAAVVADGVLYAVHVGDSRLYLVRRGRVRQMTKDHTVVAERVRMGLMKPSRAYDHPEGSALSRSMGHDLVVSLDRITLPLLQHDRLILCTDGLYNAVEQSEMASVTHEFDAAAGSRRLVELANRRATPDNVTVATFIMKAATQANQAQPSWRDRIAGFFGRSR